MGPMKKARKEIQKTGGLRKNPFRKNTLLYEFCEIAKVDWATGKSEYITFTRLPQRFHHNNGGSWHRTDGSAGLFVWVKVRENNKPNGKIIGLQTISYSSHFVPKKKFVKTQNSRCVFTGLTGHLMEDHKIGDWRRYDSGDERVNEYQTILSVLNSIKRGACKKCQKTKRRPKSPDGHFLKYTHGNENYGYPYYCLGCYIYDPVQFRNDERKYLLEDSKQQVKNLEKRNEQLQKHGYTSIDDL